MIEELFNINGKVCTCGKTHRITLPKIIVKSGAIADLTQLVSTYGAKKVHVLCDCNTFRAAGAAVCAVLKETNIQYNLYVFEDAQLEPDEKAVGAAVLHYDFSCDLCIAVGSGVINDIGKILASMAKVPYVIVATAPSMDGYASPLSSMARDGLKVSIPSKCADVIIGDIDVLKAAPMHMLRAGLGDMLAKYVSITEWRIAHEIIGEFYCEKIASLVRSALKRCVDNAEGLQNRDEEAVKAVFEGLILCGAAMGLAGVSRPASGSEHYMSHLFDMRGLSFGTHVDLHGIQCAVGTNIAVRTYEKLLRVTPCKEKALDYVKNFDDTAWAEELRQFLGKGADAMIALEEKERKYDPQTHAPRLDAICEKWESICRIIREEMPTANDMETILEKIGLPKEPKEIGIDASLSTTLKAAKDIRDKYVLPRLLWDLGVIDEFARELE